MIKGIFTLLAALFTLTAGAQIVTNQVDIEETAGVTTIEGPVGIGVAEPTASLDVDNRINVGRENQTNMHLVTRAWSGSSAILFNAESSPSFVDGGITTFGNTKYSTDPDPYSSGAGGIFFFGNGDSHLDFRVSGTSTGKGDDISWSGTAIMRLTQSGRVGIGKHPAYTLDVDGSINGESMYNSGQQRWSDFVFEENYDLPSLKEVEKHIKKNGHLKDIPTEKEVRENGYSMGDMDARLLQKIEELTLYQIELLKRIEALEAQQAKR